MTPLEKLTAILPHGNQYRNLDILGNEIGEGGPWRGNRIFASIQDLRDNCPCVEECGIVKVEVILSEIIEKGTL